MRLCAGIKYLCAFRCPWRRLRSRSAGRHTCRPAPRRAPRCGHCAPGGAGSARPPGNLARTKCRNRRVGDRRNSGVEVIGARPPPWPIVPSASQKLVSSIGSATQSVSTVGVTGNSRSLAAYSRKRRQRTRARNNGRERCRKLRQETRAPGLPASRPMISS
jgi:hypothetical protein